MVTTKTKSGEDFEFELYDTGFYGKAYYALEEKLRDGALPFDTLFRLCSIGYLQADPRNHRWHYIRNLIEIIAAAKDAEHMRTDAERLLFGDRPNAIIDWVQDYNHRAYALLDPMYFRFSNLVQAVRERRKDAGQTITEHPGDTYLDLEEIEWNRCRRLARPVWQTIVRRIHPEWVNNPQEYCPPTYSFGQIYYPGVRTARSRVIGAAVISDEIVYGIYRESVETGVKGVGPSGRDSLRRMLAEEHSELF